MKTKFNRIIATVVSMLLFVIAVANPVLSAENNSDVNRIAMTSNNKAVVYYKKGFTNPYIHYGIDGKWTQTPGIKMEDDSEHPGYSKATIDLGKSTKFEATFNDGSGHWDNNGGKNYTFRTGEWTFNKGKISYGEPQNGFVVIYYKKGFTTPYIHYGMDGNWTQVPGVKMEDDIEHQGYSKAVINLGFSDNVQATFNDGSGHWDNNGGKNYTFTSGEWIFENGKISYGEPEHKKAIVYYKKGFATPYVHYAINNNWTQIPGIKMEDDTEHPGYSKATIDLGNASEFQVAFNDGNGNWYSSYGKNYVFSTGKWMFDNGKITSGEPGNNKAVVYYKKGFTNPYIHYAINNNWTQVPGVKMDDDIEHLGYSKSVINLGDSYDFYVTFNDGSGNWNNNNGNNYLLQTGEWVFDNGEIGYYDATQVIDDGKDDDNDGLTNKEEKKYGTNPNNRDTDEDGIDDYTEVKIGANPLSANTDADGLPDGYEYYRVNTSPIKLDSNGNGINDSEEDIDKDKLTNLEEYKLGTEPYNTDTDADNLSDYEEVKTYGTNPKKVDTDEDELDDDSEVRLHFNPNDRDTDKDGIIDGREVLNQEKTYNYQTIEELPIRKTGEDILKDVTVNMSTYGDIEKKIDISKNMLDSQLNTVEGGLNSPVVIDNTASFDKANLQFKYDKSKLNGVNEDDIALYRFLEGQRILEPVKDQVMDKENCTINITVDKNENNFGTYVLVDVKQLNDYLSEPTKMNVAPQKVEQNLTKVGNVNLTAGQMVAGSELNTNPNAIKYNAYFIGSSVDMKYLTKKSTEVTERKEDTKIFEKILNTVKNNTNQKANLSSDLGYIDFLYATSYKTGNKNISEDVNKSINKIIDSIDKKFEQCEDEAELDKENLIFLTVNSEDIDKIKLSEDTINRLNDDWINVCLVKTGEDKGTSSLENQLEEVNGQKIDIQSVEEADQFSDIVRDTLDYDKDGLTDYDENKGFDITLEVDKEDSMYNLDDPVTDDDVEYSNVEEQADPLGATLEDCQEYDDDDSYDENDLNYQIDDQYEGVDSNSELRDDDHDGVYEKDVHVFTDPRSEDTDGDELTDYDELNGIKTASEVVYTDPSNYDTDDDDYSDGEEAQKALGGTTNEVVANQNLNQRYKIMRAVAKGVVTKPKIKVSNKAATIKEAKVELYGVRLGQIHKSKKIIEINNLLISLTYTKLITQNLNEFTAFTKAAVQSFQSYMGMTISGTVGPLTLGKLRTAVYLKNHNKNWKIVEHVDKIYEILEGFIWDGPINYAKNIKDTIELIANPNTIISLVHVLSNINSAKQFLVEIVKETVKGIAKEFIDFINETERYKAKALSQFLIELAVSKGIGKGFEVVKTSLKIAVKIEKAMKIAKKFSIDKLKAASKKLRIRTFKKGEKEAVSIEEELCKKEGGKCFTGDTLVKTKEGNKKIKDIQVGDYVYSENVDTGEKGYNKVINVFVRTTNEIVHVFVGNEEIKATSEHPFWKYGKGWIGAGELKVNDEILTVDGNRVRVSEVKKEYFENEPLKVYNFEVENNHSYFVSGIGVLVHNIENNDCGIEHSGKINFIRPEAAVTGSKKHGVKWKEGKARAIKEGVPQGQWHKDDLEFATQKASTLKPGESEYFDLPEGSKSIVYMPDGSIVQAKKIWIRNNGTGTWHGYPMP